MESSFDTIDALLPQLTDAEGRPGRNRIRVVLWNKDGAFPDETLAESFDVGQLEFELREMMAQAARWRALVDTGRAILGDE